MRVTARSRAHLLSAAPRFKRLVFDRTGIIMIQCACFRPDGSDESDGTEKSAPADARVFSFTRAVPRWEGRVINLVGMIST